MPNIATSATGPTTSTNGATSAPEQPPCRLGSAGASEDGRARTPEAARPQGGRAPAVGRTSTEAPSLNPATAGGLVICAENVRDSVDDAIATGELRAIDALGLRFPSPEMVTAAAALFEPAAPWACGPGRRGTEPESGRFCITVGPGVVRLGWTNPVRVEKTTERAVGHHQRDVDDAKFHVRNELKHNAGHGGQAVVSSTRRSPADSDRAGTCGVITEWSRKSRSSMCRTFRRAGLQPVGGIWPRPRYGHTHLSRALGGRRPRWCQREAAYGSVAQTFSTRIRRAGSVYLETGISAARCPAHSSLDGTADLAGAIVPGLRSLAVRDVGANRRPPRPSTESPAPSRWHSHRRAQRTEGVRSQAAGHLLHQALITKPARRQGVSAHCA
jgi:hypothetical protein